MIEGGGRLRLVDEARLGLLVGAQIGRQKLQRDHPVEPGVKGFVDDAHAAAELLFDLIVRDHPADESVGVILGARRRRRLFLGLGQHSPGQALEEGGGLLGMGQE